MVAQIFADLFFNEGFDKCFKTVIFAIYKGGDNLKAFENVFGESARPSGADAVVKTIDYGSTVVPVRQMKLDSEAIKQLKDNEVMAVSYAEGGAMGNPGEVNLIIRNDDGLTHACGNFVYGSLDLGALCKKVKVLDDFCHSGYGTDKAKAPNWGFAYMGAGNEYFYRKPELDEMEMIFDKCANEGEFYAVYFAETVRILAGAHAHTEVAK